MNSKAQPILTAEKNLLTFWDEALPNGLAGAKAGRVVFDHVLMVDVSSPGDKSEVTYEVKRIYPENFPHPIHGEVRKNETIYARYGKYIEDYESRMKGGSHVVAGTPIDNWALVDTRMAANLKFHGVYSVEALAEVSDGNAANMGMGMRELVQKAKDWLKNASSSAAALETEDRNRKLQAEIDDLRGKYEELAKSMDILPEESKSTLRDWFSKRNVTKAA